MNSENAEVSLLAAEALLGEQPSDLASSPDVPQRARGLVGAGLELAKEKQTS